MVNGELGLSQFAIRSSHFAGFMEMEVTAVSGPTKNRRGCEPLLEIRAVAKRFGSTRVLASVSLDIDQGEFLTILGASGSGKTTLLRLVAGLDLPDEGEIWMAGERLDTLPPYRRRVNTVFQHYALFPHLSVFENVAYGLRVQ
jgi:ABC-type Fe3+/spermidine/putrescine transport system ATPase subunit